MSRPVRVPRGPGPFLSVGQLRALGEGRDFRLYETLGAHPGRVGGVEGVHFAVWAPHAGAVSVIGEFNGWSATRHPMRPCGPSTVWYRFVAGARPGSLYKFQIRTPDGRVLPDKADPFAFAAELRPRSASMVWDLHAYEWGDADWLTHRGRQPPHVAPVSIYEVHLGSWRRGGTHGEHWISYRDLAPQLADYVSRLGFTHVELLPVSEHPFDGSWGYQTLGYYAPTSRYGTPDDFKFFVDTLHQAGIGVILDWVPAHFPEDEHGLANFDGTCLYEHADPRRGRHPDWRTRVFDYGRPEVRSFLISNARFWLDAYHVDGLRVDAVASMLYLDYSRAPGEWMPNEQGGRENLDAVDFLRTLNTTVYRDFPDVLMIAEESTAWPGVSSPVHTGGLGFGFKWNMGWMQDVLRHINREPGGRQHHRDEIGFSLTYAFAENFVLPLSHDEVVHAKGSILERMPGEDDAARFANIRLLYGYMFGHPGKKLLFMGNEIGQQAEWGFEVSLDWHLLESPLHAGLQRWVGDLNDRYRTDPRLHAWDAERQGFEWVEPPSSGSAALSFWRHGPEAQSPLLFVCNLGPSQISGHRLGVPAAGPWREVLNSDAHCYGGRGRGNLGVVETEPAPAGGHPQSIRLTVPPLTVLLLDASDG